MYNNYIITCTNHIIIIKQKPNYKYEIFLRNYSFITIILLYKLNKK